MQESVSAPNHPYVVVYATPMAWAHNSNMPFYIPQVHNEQTQINNQHMQQKTHNLLHTMYDSMRQVLGASSSISAWLRAHPYISVGSGIFGIYAFLALYIMHEKQYMHDKNLWMHWQQDKGLAELCEFASGDIQRELLCAIHKRYINQTNPTDYITPLSNFLVDIAAEEKRLKRFCMMMNVLSSMYLGRFLPYCQDTMHNAQRFLDRLAFIKQQFLSWASEHNWQYMERRLYI
jgi:hypothetical protein